MNESNVTLGTVKRVCSLENEKLEKVYESYLKVTNSFIGCKKNNIRKRQIIFKRYGTVFLRYVNYIRIKINWEEIKK